MSAQPSTARSRRRPNAGFRGWMPLALMSVLMVAIGVYTYDQNSTFVSQYNLNGLLIAAIPLSLAAIGQTNALMVRAFDVSVGAQITLGVVVASFTIPDGSSTFRLIWGLLAVVAIGIGVGVCNVILTTILGLSSIIATLATLSVLEGVCLWLRPVSAGSISSDFSSAMLQSVEFVPYAFIGVVVVAVLADLWLYSSGGGLTARAVGLDETSSSRRGARVGLIFVRALLTSSYAAALAAFFIAAQVQVGDPLVGLEFTLTSIAAAVLGGASLAGGRGSFVGAVLGALFLTELVNVVPFLGLDSSWSDMLVGALTLVAFICYQFPDLLGRLRTTVGDLRGSLSGREDRGAESRAPAG